MFLPSQLSSASRSRSTLSWLQIGTILQPQMLKTLVNLFKLLISPFVADFSKTHAVDNCLSCCFYYFCTHGTTHQWIKTNFELRVCSIRILEILNNLFCSFILKWKHLVWCNIDYRSQRQHFQSGHLQKIENLQKPSQKLFNR